MADALTLLKEIQGWAAQVEAFHDEVMRNLALQRAGHPKAQDFEPTGHGGSDPTAVNGTNEDWAIHEGKRYLARMKHAQEAMRDVVDISVKHRNGKRPERQPDDVEDVWCVMHIKFDSHEPRYRGLLCRPCYEQRARLREREQRELDDDDVRFHARHGKWSRKAIDPKVPVPMVQPAPKTKPIARLDRLQYGTEALPKPGAA